MLKRWILYLAIVLGLVVFYLAYQGWVAWLFLMAALCLPWLSLLVSLISMLSVHPSVTCSGIVTVGHEEKLTVEPHSTLSWLPLPPTRCGFQVTHSLTGEKLRLKPNAKLPTDHCGLILCDGGRFFVYDYLGLFRLGIRRLPVKRILVRPIPIACPVPATLDRHLAHSWQPKHGGGFAENHDLRLYRPGDGLNQVHWKLSAKTGKLIIREPMIPKTGRLLLTLDLSGEPAVLDRKLGQLLWLGLHLLEKGLRFELHALTGDGLLHLQISTEEELTAAMDELLCSAPADSGTSQNTPVAVAWRLHIGGELHEE